MGKSHEEIIAQIRRAEEAWHNSEVANLPTQYLKEWADGLEKDFNRERRSLVGCYTSKAMESDRYRNMYEGLKRHEDELVEKAKALYECLFQAIRLNCTQIQDVVEIPDCKHCTRNGMCYVERWIRVFKGEIRK